MIDGFEKLVKIFSLIALLVLFFTFGVDKALSNTYSTEQLIKQLWYNEVVYNMPHNMLVNIAGVESGFREDVINCTTLGPSGEEGIMQIYRKYHTESDPCNPIKAINYASKYLHRLYERFGSWRLAAMAYNWGPTNLENALLASQGLQGVPLSVRQYAEKVLPL